MKNACEAMEAEEGVLTLDLESDEERGAVRVGADVAAGSEELVLAVIKGKYAYDRLGKAIVKSMN